MYENILFAIEFGQGSYAAIKKIEELQKKFKSKVSLLHVVEIPTIDAFPEIVNKEPFYVSQAQSQLADIGQKLNVPAERQFIEVGSPKTKIPEIVKKHSVDLVVAGHHERRGIYHILGSTAFAIVTHVNCDVLIIPYPAY